MQPSASRRGRSITKAEQSAGTTGSSKFLGLVGTPRGNQKRAVPQRGFALMARANATTLVALVICALSVSGAIFLILELDQPFAGLMTIPSEPLRNALSPLVR